MISTYVMSQPARERCGERAFWRALTTDRSLPLPHHAGNRAAAAPAEGICAFGMSGVRSFTPIMNGLGFADAVDGKGDRLGSPAWSPPI